MTSSFSFSPSTFGITCVILNLKILLPLLINIFGPLTSTTLNPDMYLFRASVYWYTCATLFCFHFVAGVMFDFITRRIFCSQLIFVALAHDVLKACLPSACHGRSLLRMRKVLLDPKTNRDVTNPTGPILPLRLLTAYLSITSGSIAGCLVVIF